MSADTTQSFEYRQVERKWPDGTVYIIGGGPSLKGFDWSLLKDKHVLGCNDAYLLGDCVDVCVFGDREWYLGRVARAARKTIPAMPHFPGHREGLENFKGEKIAVNSKLLHYQKKGRVAGDIKVVQRNTQGFSTKGSHCAWNQNTGACAINLAYLMGAKQVILLGFDMKNEGDLPGASNWHPNLKDFVAPTHYKIRFFAPFSVMCREMKRKGVEMEVLNANLDSRLPHFPKVDLECVL